MNELFVLCQAVNLFLLSTHPPPLSRISHDESSSFFFCFFALSLSFPGDIHIKSTKKQKAQTDDV